MSKARYVDGFVIVIPKSKVAAYKKMANLGCKLWMEYGALEYRECVAEDINMNFGMPFPKLTKAKNDETVLFSWIVFKSKSHRNSVNKKVMKDPRLNEMKPESMPFKIKKMSYGGFKILVQD